MALIARFSVATLIATPALAATPEDISAFAHCLGQADGYAADAAEYGYDEDAARAANDARFATLTAIPNAPSRAALAESRETGQKDWDTRAAAIIASGGAMSGAAWEDHVAAATLCDEVGQRLRAEGLID